MKGGNVLLGRPKYDYGDKVSFVSNGRTINGVVYIIDAYGNFFNSKDTSYDILVESENTLYKHITEKLLTKIDEESEEDKKNEN